MAPDEPGEDLRPPSGWTRGTLKRAVFDRILDKKFRVKTGRVNFPGVAKLGRASGGAWDVTIDTRECSVLRGCIHEALHSLLDEGPGTYFSQAEQSNTPNGQSLWEDVIEVIEDYVCETIITPDEDRRWRRLIDRKLKG